MAHQKVTPDFPTAELPRRLILSPLKPAPKTLHQPFAAREADPKLARMLGHAIKATQCADAHPID
jgi:hypothetical protein